MAQVCDILTMEDSQQDRCERDRCEKGDRCENRDRCEGDMCEKGDRCIEKGDMCENRDKCVKEDMYEVDMCEKEDRYEREDRSERDTYEVNWCEKDRCEKTDRCKESAGSVVRVCLQELYVSEFDPRAYFRTYYSTLDEEVKFFLRSSLHAFTSGRREVEAWMQGEDDALDWTLFFNYLASLTHDRSGIEVEERLRDAFRGVVPCDLALHNPLHPLQERFDVITSTLCLEFAAASPSQYSTYFSHLVNLLLPDGVLVMMGALGNTTYALDSWHHFPSVSLTEEYLRGVVTSQGLQVKSLITLDRQTKPSQKPADHTGVFFLLAHRDNSSSKNRQE
ncbi:hypothetical protein Pmani_011967 [Petrolisthes manimaculis]|uniref:Uncharacterized protein n=1 Tax=Petrolisthes manimaculis TaxID=1843537 RepID=A0AAE1PYX6_9EUCA|nr:hypothetical protein Pmani_011967 [Petrolisthes manimaculis]